MAEPTASNYPTGLDNATSLGADQVNIKSFTLASGINNAVTSIPATAISGISAPFYLLADSELMYVEGISGTNFTPVVRGAGGTTAASHLSGITLYVVYAAGLFNQLKRAIIAIETELGINPSGASSDVVTRFSALDTRLDRVHQTDGDLDFPTSTELTIATGSVTPTQNWHTIDTEADAASDDLDTLATTNVTDGFVLFLRANNDARTVVIKHNTGNILCATAADITLDDQRDLCVLIYDSTLTKWLAGTFSITSGSSTYVPGHLQGLTLSNNGTDPTNDIDIAAGTAIDSTDAVNMVLASGLTKRLDATWVVGTNQGGLDTGTVADGTYHVWLIKRSDTGVVDVLFSTSASSPTMPTSYDYKRRIGSIIRSGATILSFSQNRDEFLLTTLSNNINNEATSTTAALKTLTVPTGIKVNALITLRVDYVSLGTAVLITSPDQSDQSVTTQIQTVTATASASSQTSTLNVRTNTSGQIRIRSSSTGATTYITTIGWIDTRGRN